MAGPDVTASSFVLWLGDAPPPTNALARAGVEVWAFPGDVAARELVALAPDLVVLAGASAARAPALIADLANERPLAAVPVAVVGEAGASAGRGVVARLAASQSEDELAAAIVAVIAQRDGSDVRTEHTLDARGIERLVATLMAERRAAVLLRGSPPGALALAADGARAAALGPRGEGSSVVRVYQRAPGKLAVLGVAVGGSADEPGAEAEPGLAGVAAVVVDDGMADWEGVAQALEARGAKVTLTDAERGALEEARATDPALVVVAAPVLATPPGLLLCEDPRLASASLLAVREDPRAELDVDRLVRAAVRLCAPEVALRARALEGEPIVARVEALGMVRWLKTYADAGIAARLRFRSIAGCGEIRVQGGKIREASFEPADGSGALEGGAAARALLALRRGTIFASPLGAPVAERVRPATGGAARSEGAARAPQDREVPRTEQRAGASEAAVEPGASRASSKADVPAPGAASTRSAVAEPEAPADGAVSARRDGSAGAEARPVASADRDARPDREPPRPAEPAAPAREPITDAAPPSALGENGPVARPTRRIAGGVAVVVAASVALAVVALGWSTASEGAGDAAAAATLATPPAAAPPAPPSAEPSPLATPERADDVLAPAAPVPPSAEDDARSEGDVPADHDRVPDESLGDGPASDGPDERPEDGTAPPALGADAPALGADAPAGPVTAEPTSDVPGEPDAPDAPSARPADSSASPNRLVLRAYEELRGRRYAEALEVAERALALDPAHPRATYVRAVSLLRLGRPDEALESATRAASLDREDPLYPLLIGDIHQQYGRRARARAAWRECTEVDPSFEPCQRRLARAGGQ